jgi:hypothetical protein
VEASHEGRVVDDAQCKAFERYVLDSSILLAYGHMWLVTTVALTASDETNAPGCIETDPCTLSGRYKHHTLYLHIYIGSIAEPHHHHHLPSRQRCLHLIQSCRMLIFRCPLLMSRVTMIYSQESTYYSSLICRVHSSSQCRTGP